MSWQAILPSFLASMVEFVEALTIVLVVGVTINWKSSLLGAIASFFTLALLILIFGSTLGTISLTALRLIIGIILVLFGMQWLRKSVLRYSGLKSLHDEKVIYEKHKAKLSEKNAKSNQFNLLGFLTSYKSVLLEGLEVVAIVILVAMSVSESSSLTFHEGVYQTSLGALGAFVVVVILGLILKKPLTLIPENTLKFIVGIMLVTFGTFWSGEGLGINWPMEDLFILILIGIYFVVSLLIILWLKTYHHMKKEQEPHFNNIILNILYAIYDFFCGDWIMLFGFALVLIIIYLLLGSLSNGLILGLYLVGIVLSFLISLRLKISK